MSDSRQFLNPSEAARRLGISRKALRYYEQRGLVVPGRNAAGWRTYGPEDMARAARIVELRGLGLGLTHAARVLAGDEDDVEQVLADHQAALEAEARRISSTVETIRMLRLGRVRDAERAARAAGPARIAFDLPWPWGGERFELGEVRALNYIIGPLGSGKTRLAKSIARAVPDARFLALDRLAGVAADTPSPIAGDAGLRSRVRRETARLVDGGAAESAALTVLLAALESSGSSLVVDMVEQGLDHASQEALIAYLRRRAPAIGPLFLLTRSSAICDLGAVGPDESIIFCPANHSPPSRVEPLPGAPGFEAVATCLALPLVRARTEGVVARLPSSVPAA